MDGIDMRNVLDVLAGCERTEVPDGLSGPQVMNLLTEFQRIETLAREARSRLERGAIRTGAHSLYQIETRAADTRRWIGLVLGGEEDRVGDAQRWAQSVLTERSAA